MEDQESNPEEPLFQILSVDGVLQTRDEIILDAIDLIKLPKASVRLLLNQFSWDKDRLFENFWSGNLSDQLESLESDGNESSRSNSKKTSTCGICYSKMFASKFKMTGLKCGHSYCNECWVQYLRGKIMDDGLSQTIPCPTNECNILVDDQMVLDLVTDPEVRLRYQILMANIFVESSKFFNWCSSPGCTKAIKVTSDLAKFVRCDCGNEFCFPCGCQWHEPVDCDLLKKWMIKCNDDSETINWINAKTKPCPKCQTPIEKNGGCNHMICAKESCKFEFCWLCLNDWENYSHDCNRFVQAEAEQNPVSPSSAALAKYLFYYNRYMNHQRSLSLEKQIEVTLIDLKATITDRGVAGMEIKFLDKALEGLCQSRRTLMYTYVFAFYLQRDNQAEIFEDNQNDLESATEKLSSCLERELNADNVLRLKKSILDQLNYCLARRQALLEHVTVGNEADVWNFN